MKIANPFPDFPLDDWRATKDTIHLFLQIVGKIRLTTHPKTNHWWHVTFYVSVRGLTTGPIPYDNGLFELEFNFTEHALHINTNWGDSVVIHLTQYSVAQFYELVLLGLKQCGIEASIQPQPYDIPHIPENHFADCHPYKIYDKDHAETMWQILISVNNVFQAFRGRFIGKSTPVHLFWHHFDLALTRFNGDRLPIREGVSQVEREAYSHEVISFGFWFGDDNLPEPAFYAYGVPAPDAVYEENIQPAAAYWNKAGGMALLKYADIRQAENPQQAILNFLESVYQAYARHMGWDVAEFALES